MVASGTKKALLHWVLSSKSLNSSERFRAIMALLLSTPMGVDYVAIGFDMKVRPLVTHNAA